MPKGLSLLGKGLGLTGRVAKADLGMATMGGASKYLNYYTNAARTATNAAGEALYSRAPLGYQVKAGFFVNAARAIAGKPALYSSTEATVIGRAWQNQAIGLGLFNTGVSVGAGIYNLTPSSGNQNTGGIGISGGNAVPAIDNLSHR